MKRVLSSILIATAVCWATAQSAFTIVRPADGSKVRETVRLLFPKNSIPADGGYVGIYIGGKFVEAVVPARGANYLYYDIDTKARNIPDGPLAIEAVLFQEFSEKPRIVDRSSINVTVANSANIPIPENGLKLRYKFKPGTQWVYSMTQRVAVNSMSEAMAGQTSKSSLLAGADVEHVRLLYAVDNAYPDGDGLVRMQAIPEKGKHEITVTLQDTPKTFMDYDIHPIYMRLRGTGREVFGNVPRYFPLQGTAGESFSTDLFADFPLPTLPEDSVREGSLWNPPFQLGDLDLDRIDEMKSLVAKVPARGEFKGVEWQNGHPCARLRYTLGVRDPKGPTSSSRLLSAQAIDEDIWFAMDLGTVIKMIRTYTIDTKVETQTGGANGSGAQGAPGAPPAPNKPRIGPRGAGGAPGGGGGAGSGASGAGWQGKGGMGPGQRGGGPPQGFVPPTGPGRGGPGQNAGVPSMGGGQRSGGGGAAARVVRITVEQVFELEK